jgi:hypothetical protein
VSTASCESRTRLSAQPEPSSSAGGDHLPIVVTWAARPACKTPVTWSGDLCEAVVRTPSGTLSTCAGLDVDAPPLALPGGRQNGPVPSPYTQQVLKLLFATARTCAYPAARCPWCSRTRNAASGPSLRSPVRQPCRTGRGACGRRVLPGRASARPGSGRREGPVARSRPGRSRPIVSAADDHPAERVAVMDSLGNPASLAGRGLQGIACGGNMAALRGW